MNGEIKRTFICCRCDHQETIRNTECYSLNCDFPSDEASAIFETARMKRRKCSLCGGTMHPDEATTRKLVNLTSGLGRARVL